MNEKIPVDCIFCGSKARVVHYDSNMWYIQCSNQDCKKHDKYAYLGSTQSASVDAWNFNNRVGSFRKGCKDKNVYKDI